MRVILCALTLLFGVSVATTALADNGDAVVGMWLTKDGKARVEIVKNGDVYDGKIVWLKEPQYPADDAKGMGGQTKVDRENPDPSQRTQPIIGLPLVKGFKYAGDNVWEDGTIYDPESGKTYSCKMTLMMDGTLRVRGYVGISLFGRTEIWTRPPVEGAP